jgi:hypothetical protein
MSKSKLHELLAVEGDLEGTYKSILEETTGTFTKKPQHFMGAEKKCRIFDENRKDETPPAQRQEIVTTVPEKIEYTAGHIIRYLDAVLQKEATNQIAIADLDVSGIAIGKDLPATFLLGLETKLKHIRKVFAAMPTLPPSIKWESDEGIGKDIYRRVHPEQSFKTAKTIIHKVLVPAQFPKEGEGGTSLPAQIERWEENQNVGEYTTEQWSGMVTPTEKSKILGRIDQLVRATKKARQRANSAEVKKVSIGKNIFDFIIGSA